MLGSSLYPALAEAGYETTATDLHPAPVHGLPTHPLDVRDEADVRAQMSAAHPDIVFHLAAETELETCEQDPDHAFRTNAVGTQNVALAARGLDATLVYISTAGVFDGQKTTGPYIEFDSPNPINVYGASKFQGERFVQMLTPRHFIVRAGWMVGGAQRDHKFVAKIIDQIRAGAGTIYAVTDKLGTPTYTADFAANLIDLLPTGLFGLYHMTCLGQGSRLDVATEILKFYGRDDIKVRGVTSEYFQETFPAPRPRSEMMRNYMLDLHGLNHMRPWREAIRDYLQTAAFDVPAS